MAGTIDVIFEGIIPASPFLQSAQIRPLALAVTTPAQVAALAVPTLEELGYGPMNMTSWWVLLAPRGLAAGLREAIAAAVQKALRQPEFVSFANSLGVVRGEGLVGNALGEMIRGETAKYQELIAAMGVLAE
jgi:tripartite-type tricarboxylate transporter receptor subunit TctC